jgi:HD-GYP domain-containing protein (c-di-GMP phosphodiesterase class II)
VNPRVPLAPAEEGAPFKRRGRILLALLAVLGFVGLAPLASVAWKLIDTNKEALKTAQQEYQLLLASSIAHQVDIQVQSLRAQLVRVAWALGGTLGRTGPGGADEIRRVLSDVADDRMVYLRYADLRGGSVDSGRTATLPRDLEPLFLSGFRKTAESLAGSQGERPEMASISGPILLAGDPPRAALVLSAPVVAAGGFRGVLSALVDLQTVWDGVMEANRGGHTVFALDEKGHLFASSGPERVPPGTDVRRSGIVRRFLDSPGNASETMPFLMDEDARSERYMGSYEVTREGWGVFVQAKERQVYLPVRAMVESTLSWALLALSLAILAAVGFASTLSKPINRLAAASRAFAAGDLSVRAEVRSRNELGELADTFNRMAAAIEDHIRRLKKAAEENNELFLGTIRALAQAIDAKDPYTRGHSVRVNQYAVILARYVGLSNDDVRDIHVASLLHDVGKIGIDDAILKKQGPLTAEEFAVMKTHPVLGANIMSTIRQMRNMLPGLRNHHERWVGGGYPDGLSGDGIPLMARIIAVADTFDAMTTHRPYQKAMEPEVALQRLNELRGVVLDARLVDAFHRAYRAGEFGKVERTKVEEAVLA